MIVTKHVPTAPGLTAAHAAFEAHGVDEFRDWAEDLGYFDDTSIAIDDLPGILDRVQDTPMGRAWKAAMAQALALTEADEYRAYDEVDFEGYENTVAKAIYALADTVEATSPLLKDVAAAIRWYGYSGTYETLGAFAQKRAGVNEEGILIRQWSQHEPNDVVAPWAHIEPIMPGLRSSLVALIDALRVQAPPYAAEADPGASRTPAAYASK